MTTAWWSNVAVPQRLVGRRVMVKEDFRAVLAGSRGTIDDVIPMKRQRSGSGKKRGQEYGIRVKLFHSRSRVQTAVFSRAEFRAHLVYLVRKQS